MVKKMKLQLIPSNWNWKKQKAKGSWKLSLFKHFKAITFMTKPKSLKNSNLMVSVLDSSWSQSRQRCQLSHSGEVIIEMASKALRSNRLFFEPGSNTNSILEAARFPFEDCVALALETADPYMEFRLSMEEMVEACQLEDQEHLEELLAWYLKMNRKKNHGFIVGAFIDMFATTSVHSRSSSSCFISAN